MLSFTRFLFFRYALFVVSPLLFLTAVVAQTPPNYVLSDGRTKRVIGDADEIKSLLLARSLDLYKYKFKDTLHGAARPQRGVSAQEVVLLLPNVVSRRAGFVPDIYKLITRYRQDHGKLTLWVRDNGLRAGERVRFYIGDKAEYVRDVVIHEADNDYLVVLPEDVFKGVKDEARDHIFLYGRYVQDLMSVDYDQLFMLNIAATKKLIRENEKIQNILNGLMEKARMRDERIQALKLRLAELEKH